MIIGITGGSGVGKSTVSSELKKRGYFVIDADKVAHKLMGKGTPCLKEVTDLFGEEYLNPDGTLDRKRLGAKVFNDAELLESLNKITHKYIRKEIEFLAQGKNLVVIDAALLFESGLDDLCRKTVFVSCPEDVRVKRIISRDNVGEDYAKSRINAQKTDDFYREKCDFEIINDGKQNVAFKIEEILTCLKG